MIDRAYAAMDGQQVAEEYNARHGIESAAILTIFDDERAAMTADYLRERVEGKTVVEIGGGIGLLAMHLAPYARRVFVIEAQPMWGAVFVWALYAKKPKNVTFILGAADELAGTIHGDVALYCTLSGHAAMRRAAEPFAPIVLDVYAEIVNASPELRSKARSLIQDWTKVAPPSPRGAS